MAGDMQITLRLRADATQLKAEVAGAQRATQALGPATQGAGQQAAAGLDQASQAAGRARDALGGLGGAAGAARRSVAGLADSLASAVLPALRLAAAGAALLAIARAGDQATQAVGRLQVATGSLDAARDVYGDLYRISLQTGVATRDAAAAFQRFAIAAGEAGATRAQILAIVQLLQQAGAVAGASLQETTSATIQLGQGLASGKLQGDELRSVLENMPNLAVALARELGVSVGQLREMGAEGRLTAATVIPALVRASAAVRQEFERLPPSMERGLAVLGVSTQRFLGDLDRALGLSRGIAGVLEGVAASLDRLRVSSGLGSPLEAAEAAAAAARQRLDQARGAMEGIEGAPAPGGARGIARTRLARAEEEFRAAEERLSQLRAEAATREQADEAAAAARRSEAARQESGRAIDDLRNRLDRRLELQRRYAADIDQIDRAVELGVIRPEDAARDRAALDRHYREQIAAIRNGGGRAAAAADTERARLVESLRTPAEIFADEIARLRRILGEGAEGTELFARGVLRAKEALDAATRGTRAAGDSAERLEGLFARMSDVFEGTGRDAARAMADALVGVRALEGGVMGLVQRLASGILSRLIEEQMTRPLMQAAQVALQSLSSGLGSLLGLGGGGAAAAKPLAATGGAPMVGGFHGGGIVGGAASFRRAIPAAAAAAIWREAPRYHTGTGPVLGAGEVPAILKRGEGVFTAEQMSALSPAQPVTVQIIDQRGAGAPAVETQETQGPGGERVIRALIRAETSRGLRDGAFDRDMALSFGLRRSGQR